MYSTFISLIDLRGGIQLYNFESVLKDYDRLQYPVNGQVFQEKNFHGKSSLYVRENSKISLSRRVK